MSALWQQLVKRKELDNMLILAIEQEYGVRGKKALAAIDSHRVKKYLDFFVVSGKTDEYVVDENICTCRDFIFRNRECWHILAVRIAEACGSFDRVDLWYQDKWKKQGDNHTIIILRHQLYRQYVVFHACEDHF
jgi:predicted nucleic acid-binding Zn finger protein